MAKLWKVVSIVAVIIGVGREVAKSYGYELNKDVAVSILSDWSERLGFWAIPVYIGIHTITLSLCLPYAVFFEAAASMLFGFLPALLCVFTAKLLGASLSFSIGRLIFRSSTSAMQWVTSNIYFSILSRGVEKDGWKFVLLARFSPIPSYIINYGLAATNVSFFVDFLLPTIIGCMPMILQNTSIGSLAGAAVASASGSKKSPIWSYVFPMLGIVSSVALSWRIKRYSSDIAASPANNSVESTETKGKSQ
ncbi:hypothetical protein ACFE04_024573 [Oxalis oulophora]